MGTLPTMGTENVRAAVVVVVPVLVSVQEQVRSFLQEINARDVLRRIVKKSFMREFCGFKDRHYNGS